MGDYDNIGWHIAVGFLACLSLVELLLIILLLLDRRKKLKQIYELSLVSFESASHHIARTSPSVTNKDETSECPARSVFPALARRRLDGQRHKTVSNDTDLHQTAQKVTHCDASMDNNKRGMSKSMYTSADSSWQPAADYADVNELEIQSKKKKDGESMQGFVLKDNPKDTMNTKLEVHDANQDAPVLKDAVDLLRQKSTDGDDNRGSDGPRYSLVRFDRLKFPKSATSSRSTSDSFNAGDYARISSKTIGSARTSFNTGDWTTPDLLDEISIATAIDFDDQEASDSPRKKVGRSETFSSTGTGVYDPIEPRRPPSLTPKCDESDNDLTDVSDLDSGSESEALSPLSCEGEISDPWSQEDSGCCTVEAGSVPSMGLPWMVPEVIITKQDDAVTVLAEKGIGVSKGRSSSTDNEQACLLP